MEWSVEVEIPVENSNEESINMSSCLVDQFHTSRIIKTQLGGHYKGLLSQNSNLACSSLDFAIIATSKKLKKAIQIHNLLIGFMSHIGEYLDCDEKNSSNFLQSFVRLRVLLDICKPLTRSMKLKKPVGKAKKVIFEYEKLRPFLLLISHTKASSFKYHKSIIFHNKHGLLVTTKTIVMRGRVRPLEVEVMALHHTISWVAELGFDNIHFETSCKTVMDYFSKPSFGYLDFNVNLFKCRTKLSHFSNSMVSFVRRQTNFVAYTLTNKLALSFMIQ
ncbi:hypothetical protein HKD37_04G011608 [Glycine soja]